MAVYETLYYGYVGIAVLVMLLILYIIYATSFIFTTDNNVLKFIAYITVLLDTWFIGVIHASMAEDGGEKNS